MALLVHTAALVSFVALAASAPTPAIVSPPKLAAVDVRIMGPQSNHYSASNQAPTSDQSQHLTVIVGQTLSLDHDTLHVQGLQIAAIKAGESLSLLPTKVVDGDRRVGCTARINERQEKVVFDMKDNGILLDAGRLVKVTRLSCSITQEAS